MLIVRLVIRMGATMIESVVALLMFVNAEIKEARLQVDGMAQCLRGKRQAERQFSETVMYKCWKGQAELEDNIDGSKSIKKLIIDQNEINRRNSKWKMSNLQ